MYRAIMEIGVWSKVTCFKRQTHFCKRELLVSIADFYTCWALDQIVYSLCCIYTWSPTHKGVLEVWYTRLFHLEEFLVPNNLLSKKQQLKSRFLRKGENVSILLLFLSNWVRAWRNKITLNDFNLTIRKIFVYC